VEVIPPFNLSRILILQHPLFLLKCPHPNKIQVLAHKTTTDTLLTFSMEQSHSSEANRFSASQETPQILWNPKVHYRIHKCPPPVPILSQIDPVHALTSHFLKIHLNIILPSMPGTPQWSLSLRFPHQNPIYTSFLPHTCYMHRLAHYSQFYIRTIFGEEYRS